jgi:hypothetical protein
MVNQICKSSRLTIESFPSLQNHLASAYYDFQVDDGDDSIRLRVQRRVAADQRDRRLRRWIRNLRLDQGGSAGRLVSHLLGTWTIHSLSFRFVSTLKKFIIIDFA